MKRILLNLCSYVLGDKDEALIPFPAVSDQAPIPQPPRKDRKKMAGFTWAGSHKWVLEALTLTGLAVVELRGYHQFPEACILLGLAGKYKGVLTEIFMKGVWKFPQFVLIFGKSDLAAL